MVEVSCPDPACLGFCALWRRNGFDQHQFPPARMRYEFFLGYRRMLMRAFFAAVAAALDHRRGFRLDSGPSYGNVPTRRSLREPGSACRPIMAIPTILSGKTGGRQGTINITLKSAYVGRYRAGPMIEAVTFRSQARGCIRTAFPLAMAALSLLLLLVSTDISQACANARQSNGTRKCSPLRLCRRLLKELYKN